MCTVCPRQHAPLLPCAAVYADLREEMLSRPLSGATQTLASTLTRWFVQNSARTSLKFLHSKGQTHNCHIFKVSYFREESIFLVRIYPFSTLMWCRPLPQWRLSHRRMGSHQAGGQREWKEQQKIAQCVCVSGKSRKNTRYGSENTPGTWPPHVCPCVLTPLVSLSVCRFVSMFSLLVFVLLSELVQTKRISHWREIKE